MGIRADGARLESVMQISEASSVTDIFWAYQRRSVSRGMPQVTHRLLVQVGPQTSFRATQLDGEDSGIVEGFAGGDGGPSGYR